MKKIIIARDGWFSTITQANEEMAKFRPDYDLVLVVSKDGECSILRVSQAEDLTHLRNSEECSSFFGNCLVFHKTEEEMISFLMNRLACEIHIDRQA